MIHQPILAYLAAHLKAEAVIILSILGWLGLLASEVTSPKVLAVMVFLSDWNMRWTWEWWVRTIFYLGIVLVVFWLQKRKCRKQLEDQKTEGASKVALLQGELRHTELLLSAAQVRIEVLQNK